MSDKHLLANVIPQEHLDAMKRAAKESDGGAVKSIAGVTPEFHLDGTWQRNDAAEGFFVARQLEFMRPGIYAVQYPALKAQRLIPFNMGVDTGAEQYTATVIDQVGEVKITQTMSDDIPMVELKTSQVSMPLFHLSLGYTYTIQEARAAMYARVPLIPQKALRTREQMERKLDDIAFLGETSTGIVGLLGLSGTDTYTTPATGQGNSKAWKDKSSDDVLADLNGAPNQVIVNTKEIEVPDTCVLPLSAKTLISNRRVGDGTSMTILSYFLANQEFIKEVEGTYKAETAGGSSSTRATWYVKDPTRLEMIVPQPFEQFPPFSGIQRVVTACHMRTGGVACYLPKSVIYSDGI